MSKVGEWLEGIGLGRYSEIFAKNDIGFDELSELTENDLKELGVSIGHMRRLLRAIQGIQPDHTPAERRQVSVLFADIVGFTNLSSKLDPEDLLDVVNSFQTKSTSMIEDYRGMVVKFVGDGLLAFFGWPVASERDAFNSVRAAKKLSERLSAEIQVSGQPIRIRVGVATGLAVVGDLASNMPDVFGDVPNLAARLQGLAEPGTVLISEGTHRLVNQVFDCEPTGPLDVKGLGETKAWSVLSEPEGTGQSRLRTPAGATRMLGRDDEMEQLNSIWKDVENGNLQIACVEGEAGLGKSRLASEFVTSLNDMASIYTLFGSPDAGQRPLKPIVDLIQRAAGFLVQDADDARLSKLTAMLTAAKLDAVVNLPIFAGLCGLPVPEQTIAITPERRRLNMFEAVKRIVETQARQSPVVILIEDLHWLDSTTYELAGFLGTVDPSLPILILSTTRPEQSPPWAPTQPVSMLKLRPLDREHSAGILQETLGGGNEALSNVVRQILERADGIPLYLEELSQSVHLTIDNLSIPSSLQDSLMARLDRLGDEREIALVASILGRDIEHGLLTEVLARHPQRVIDGLDRLVAEQVLTKINSDDAAEAQYRFRHALLLEAAYDSQLLRKRRDVHSQIADVLIRWSNDGRYNNPATVAHHLSRAKRPNEASAYYRKAGLVALGNAHYEDAERLIKSALAELGLGIEAAGEADMDAKSAELEMQTELGTSLIARKGFAAPAVGKAFADAERIGRELGPGPGLARSLWGAWLFKLVSGDLNRALELSHELTGLGTAFAELDGNGLLAEATWALGDTQFWVADLEESIVSLRKSVALYDPEGHADHALLYGQDPFVAAHCYIGYTESVRGYHSNSWASLKTSMAHADTLNHPFSTAWSLCFPANVAILRGEVFAARIFAERALKHTSDQMMPFWQTAMMIIRGWTTAKMGDPKAGLAEAESALAMYAGIGSETVQPFFRAIVTECLALADKPEEAAEMLQSGFDLARKTGERVSEILLHLKAAEIGATIGIPDADISKHLETALEMARDSGATSLELSAAYAMAVRDAPECLEILQTAIDRSPEPTKSRMGRRALKLLSEAKQQSPALV